MGVSDDLMKISGVDHTKYHTDVANANDTIKSVNEDYVTVRQEEYEPTYAMTGFGRLDDRIDSLSKEVTALKEENDLLWKQIRKIRNELLLTKKPSGRIDDLLRFFSKEK